MQRTLAVVYLITAAQGIEVVALAREQAARHQQAVGDGAEGLGLRDTLLQHAEFVIHKADVERRVMDHQLAAADKVEEFVGNLIEGRLVGQKSSLMPCTP